MGHSSCSWTYRRASRAASWYRQGSVSLTQIFTREFWEQRAIRIVNWPLQEACDIVIEAQSMSGATTGAEATQGAEPSTRHNAMQCYAARNEQKCSGGPRRRLVFYFNNPAKLYVKANGGARLLVVTSSASAGSKICDYLTIRACCYSAGTLCLP